MAFDTQSTVAGLALDGFLVEVMFVGIVRRSLMALQAKVVTLFVQGETMGIVAIAAPNPALIHLALHE
jgi:hypothetical protein